MKSLSFPYRLWRVNKLAFFGFVMVGLMFFTAIFASVLAPYGFNEQNLDAASLSPSRQHPLGTDLLGRDVLSRIIWGAQPAAFFVVASLVIGTPLGVILGAISGYYRGWVDWLIMRITDVFFAFPGLLFIFFIAATLGPRIDAVLRALPILKPVIKAGYIDYLVVVTILSLINWPGMARLVRGQFRSVRERDYVLAAEAIGARDWRIIFRHILPNALPPVVVSLSMRAGGMIMAEAFLSFLGIGITATIPHPSWGAMIFANYGFWRTRPYLLWAPGLVVAVMILSFNLLGDGLNDLLNPAREKGGR